MTLHVTDAREAARTWMLVLVPIHASGPLSIQCAACGKMHNQAHGDVFADLNGTPGRAYYGRDCLVPAMYTTRR